jgi:hypothetical protein
MNDTVRWTDLTVGQIAQRLYADYGIRVSKSVVRINPQ